MRENQPLSASPPRPRVDCCCPSSHADLHFVRALRNRSVRDEHQLYIAEGSRFIIRALQQHVPIHSLIYSSEMFTSKAEAALVRQVNHLGVPCRQIDRETYVGLSQLREPQGLLAVMPQSWQPLKNARPHQGLGWIAVDDIRSSGNLGSILRTAEACGVAGLICVGDGTDPFDPGCVRASMGAMFGQRFIRTTLNDLRAWKRRIGCTFVGASPDGEREHHFADMRSASVLVLGNERTGLGEDITSLCDLLVRIPMAEGVDSLNVSVSAGVLLYEMRRQRAIGKTQKRHSYLPAQYGTQAIRRKV